MSSGGSSRPSLSGVRTSSPMKNGHEQAETGGSQSGRFVNRLDEQDREIAALKERCELLTLHCIALEKWKNSVEKWIREEFDPNFSPGSIAEDQQQDEEEDQQQDGEENKTEDAALDSDIDEEETRLFDSPHGQDEHTDSQLEEMCTPSIVDVRGAVNGAAHRDDLNTSGGTTRSARPPRTVTLSTPEQKQKPSPPAKRSSSRSPAKNNAAIDEETRKSYPLKKRFKESNNDETAVTATPNPSKPLVLTIKSQSSKTLGKHENQVASNKPSTSTSSKINAVDDDDDDDDVYIDLRAKSANSVTDSKTAKNQGVVKPPQDVASPDNDQEDVVCIVCVSPDVEKDNEIIFCDKCNIAVHQACYGIQKIPKGNWYCNPCAANLNPAELQCRLCPNKGGALKPVLSPSMNTWAHVLCTWWIPEVKMASTKSQEPVVGISSIDKRRLALVCCICKVKTGAPIQCKHGKCRTAFHPTCARAAGLRMDMKDGDADADLMLEAFCKIHKDVGKKVKPKSKQK